MKLYIAFIAVLIATSSCGYPLSTAAGSPTTSDGQRALPDTPLVVRVLWAVNPRYESPIADSPDILAGFAKAAHLYDSLPVVFRTVAITSVDSMFADAELRDSAAFEDAYWRDLVPYLSAPEYEDSVPIWLQECYDSGFRSFPFDELLVYAKRALPAGALQGVDTYTELARVVTDYHLSRLHILLSWNARDGQPISIDYPATSVPMWYLPLREEYDYDLVITNQPFVGADLDPSAGIHFALRGGVAFGFCGWKLKNAHPIGPLSPVVVSTFWRKPPESLLRMLQLRRGDPTLWQKGVAAVFAHELGHDYYGWTEAYDHEGCIMNPCIGLHLPGWVSTLAPTRCALEHRRFPFL